MTATRTRTTSPAPSARAPEAVGTPERGDQRREAWQRLQRDRAAREAALAPFRGKLAEAKAAYDAAVVVARDKVNAAAAELRAEELRLEATEAGAERFLAATTPPVVERLRDALRREHQRTLERPFATKSVVDRAEDGAARLDDEGRARRVIVSGADQIAARAKELLTHYRRLEDLRRGDPDGLAAAVRAAADLIGFELSED